MFLSKEVVLLLIWFKEVSMNSLESEIAAHYSHRLGTEKLACQRWIIKSRFQVKRVCINRRSHWKMMKRRPLNNDLSTLIIWSFQKYTEVE
jgi:hypothetical protein